MRVKCKIYGEQTNDAKLSIDDDGDVFICQNIAEGSSVDNLLGYRYSWRLCYGAQKDKHWSEWVTDLESVEGLRAMQVGDIVTNKDGDGPSIIVEVLTNTFAHQYKGEGDIFWITFEYAEGNGWKLKGQEEEKETIEIAGHTYDKKKFEEAVKDLEEVE